MTETVLSNRKIPIRLTSERWAHITEEHCELAGLRLEVLETVSNPSKIFAGKQGELMAVRKISSGKHLVVVYRDFETDGFIITAFMTSKPQSLDRRTKLWPLN